MNIVVLDGGTTNPGDLSWAPLEALGTLTVYPDTPPELVLDRARNAQAVIVNRVHLTREMIDTLPELAYIGTLSIGVNQVDGAAARERGIPLCNVPFYCVDTGAQHARSLLLCLCGQVHAFSDTCLLYTSKRPLAAICLVFPFYSHEFGNHCGHFHKNMV